MGLLSLCKFCVYCTITRYYTQDRYDTWNGMKDRTLLQRVASPNGLLSASHSAAAITASSVSHTAPTEHNRGGQSGFRDSWSFLNFSCNPNGYSFSLRAHSNNFLLLFKDRSTSTVILKHPISRVYIKDLVIINSATVGFGTSWR